MTTEHKHTPGPWRTKAQTDFSGWLVVADDCDIASVYLYGPTTKGPSDRDEVRGNLSLMLRAPDLLAENERLRAMNSSLVAELHSCESNHSKVEHQNALLVKAEGDLLAAAHLEAQLRAALSLAATERDEARFAVDELLEALRSLLSWDAIAKHKHEPIAKCVAAARAAIAKAEGK